MADFATPLRMEQERTKAPVAQDAQDAEMPSGTYDDQELLDLWDIIKRETFDSGGNVFTRQWQRNLWYILGRQWIEYQSRSGGWRDKRMAAWIPRPVTNKCKETVQAIRAMYTSINLSVNVRPNGSEPENVSAAATADELAPLLHEAHFMNQVMNEFDFWLCATGNAFIHTYVDYDMKHGQLVITAEQCTQCGAVAESSDLTGAQPSCPDCGGNQFINATDPVTGAPIQRTEPKGVPTTMVLSPLEITFPHSYTRFDDLPYVVRSRWRTKRYFQNHPILKTLVGQITWQKSPLDYSLALYTSLVTTNDLGITSGYADGSGGGGQTEDGISEHEVWMKPCDAYPEGLVFRVIGDAKPIVVHLEEQENLPGPLPYKDSDGNPLFTFAHGIFEHVGGRILGSGPLDVIIQKQDQINQLDSLVLLIIQRMANPVWLEPKGCEIQKLTGMPGLVVKYKLDPMGGPNSKPERIPGIPIDTGLMALREQYLRDIEELAGTFDIIKGQKPQGVEAFSALQLLVERSQARFSPSFQSRGDAYKNWFKFAIELEREFGPDQRTKAILTPARGYTFQTFKRAQLQGSLSIVVEDGSTQPKTNLSMRASLDHAMQLGILNMTNSDQKYQALKLIGLTKMDPTLDIHMQAALQKQQAFEAWVQDKGQVMQFVQGVQQQQAAYAQAVAQTQAQQQQQLAGATDPNVPMPSLAPMPPAPPPILDGTPLKWFPWYDAQIHLQEFLKWANDDHIRELLQTAPICEKLLAQHLQDIQAAIPQPAAPIEKPRISFAFGGADLIDPQIRQVFDNSEGLGPPAPGAPHVEPPAPKQPQGAGRAMQNSNDNSAPAGNKPQPQAKG